VGEKVVKEDGIYLNLSTYKLAVVADVLEALEDLKKSAKEVKSKLAVEAINRRKKKFLKHKGAYFELLVNKYVDIENLINSLEEPERTIIKERLFLKEPEEVKRKLGVRRKREAEKLVRRAINKFYDLLEKYRKT